MLIDRDAVIEVAEFLTAGRLLPPGARRRSTRRSSTCTSAASRSTSSPSPRRSSVTGTWRRSAAARTWARLIEPDADGRQRRAVRADRRAQGGAAEPDRRRGQDRRASATTTRPRSRRPSTGRSRSCSRSASSAWRRLLPAQEPPPRRLRPTRLPPRSTAARSAASGPASQDLDTLTTGLQKSDLVILAARPIIGKTSFALNIAEHAAVREDKKSVGVFSLEMSKEQLVLRLLCSVANIDSQRLRTGFLEEMDFTRHRAGHELAVGGADLHRRHAQHQRRWSCAPRHAGSRPSRASTS